MSHHLATLRTHADFPRPGVLFYDIAPWLSDALTFKKIIDDLTVKLAYYDFDLIAAIDARGFIFAGALSLRCNKGMVLLRKPGKLPGPTIDREYQLEYGKNRLSLQQGVVAAGQRVLILDDVLATGGTTLVASQLLEAEGASIAAIACALEITALQGRTLLPYAVETWLAI